MKFTNLFTSLHPANTHYETRAGAQFLLGAIVLLSAMIGYMLGPTYAWCVALTAHVIAGILGFWLYMGWSVWSQFTPTCFGWLAGSCAVGVILLGILALPNPFGSQRVEQRR